MFVNRKSLLLVLVVMGYTYGKVSFDEFRKIYNKQVLNLLDRYESGNYSFQQGQSLRIYKADPSQNFDVNMISDSVVVGPTLGQSNCLGIKTETGENILLNCPEVQPNDPGCFQIFGSSEENADGESSDDTQINKACVEILNENCVGLVTPSKWTLVLDCLPSKSLEKSKAA